MLFYTGNHDNETFFFLKQRSQDLCHQGNVSLQSSPLRSSTRFLTAAVVQTLWGCRGGPWRLWIIPSFVAQSSLSWFNHPPFSIFSQKAFWVTDNQTYPPVIQRCSGTGWSALKADSQDKSTDAMSTQCPLTGPHGGFDDGSLWPLSSTATSLTSFYPQQACG